MINTADVYCSTDILKFALTLNKIYTVYVQAPISD